MSDEGAKMLGLVVVARYKFWEWRGPEKKKRKRHDLRTRAGKVERSLKRSGLTVKRWAGKDRIYLTAFRKG